MNSPLLEIDLFRLSTMAVLASVLTAGCSNEVMTDEPELTPDESGLLTPEELADARSRPATAPVRYTTSEGEEFLGHFTLVVGSDESPYFTISGYDDTGRSIGGRLLGRISAIQPVRAPDGSYTVQYERSLETTDWLLENLGNLRVADPHATWEPRVLDLRVDASGLMSLKIDAVEFILDEGVGVSFGDEITVTAAGRLIGACLADGGGGRVLQDPEFALNEACEQWLSGFDIPRD